MGNSFASMMSTGVTGGIQLVGGLIKTVQDIMPGRLCRDGWKAKPTGTSS